MKDYIWIDLKIMFRIPLSVFFSLIYPIIMMFIIILSYGNIPIGNGYHLVDKYFMIAIGMGILPLTIISYPMWMGNSLENNSLDRLNFFGIKTSKVLIGDIIAHIILSIFSMAIDILVAWIAFGLQFPDFSHFIAFLIQYILAVITALMLGGVVALLFQNTQILMPFGLVVMFAAYMFCGVFITFDQMPDAFKKIASYIPMKYAMNDFFDIWTKKIYWDRTFLILSAIYMVILGVVLTILLKCNAKLNTKKISALQNPVKDSEISSKSNHVKGDSI
ncbi:MAG: ABC-2 type transporter [Clostridium sp.]|jgi:ABC-2 type transport system permease protein